jgi:plasmid stability protein
MINFIQEATKMKNINVRMSLPEDLHRKVKVTAAKHGMNLNDALVFVIRDYYKRIDENEEYRD